MEVRRQDGQVGLLPVGDVLMMTDGGRKCESVPNYFGMGKARKAHDKSRTLKDGKTIAREIILFFDEKSVKSRKHRVKTRNDEACCAQRANMYFNAATTCPTRRYNMYPGVDGRDRIRASVFASVVRHT